MTNPSSDVVERLRHIVRKEQRLISSIVALPQEDCATLTEAIATIERLSAERDELEREIARERCVSEAEHKSVERLSAELERVRSRG